MDDEYLNSYGSNIRHKNKMVYGLGEETGEVASWIDGGLEFRFCRYLARFGAGTRVLRVVDTLDDELRVDTYASDADRLLSEGVGNTSKIINVDTLNSKPLYRVMTEAELNAVKETERLRGGREGTTYFTDAKFTSADTAKRRLALPTPPEYRVEFEITNNPRVQGGNTVKPAYDKIGG